MKYTLLVTVEFRIIFLCVWVLIVSSRFLSLTSGIYEKTFNAQIIDVTNAISSQE